MEYYHVQNESSSSEALVRCWGESAVVIAGASSYEKCFVKGKPDTTIEVPKVNFLLVSTKPNHPIVSALINRIGPRVEVNAISNSFNGRKLPDQVIREAKDLRSKNYTVTAISKLLGISRPTVLKYIN